MNLCIRAYHRILKLALRIVDLAGSERTPCTAPHAVQGASVQPPHIAAAIYQRSAAADGERLADAE
jgi:hypothetical protein